MAHGAWLRVFRKLGNLLPSSSLLTQVATTTNVGDVVWEPFGGLASASVAAVLLGRHSYVSEIDGTFVDLAKERLEEAQEYINANGIYNF